MHKVLIIGHGSIGKRHAEVSQNADCEVHVVTKQEGVEYTSYEDTKTALKDNLYDLIIIANETDKHIQTIIDIQKTNFSKKILVEKPIFADHQTHNHINTNNIYVGYQLRFHPVLQKLFSELENKTVITANVYVGSYLPDWRPDQDYRACYSAKKEQGGGVLRDLSHEIDYLNWLLGDWKKVSAIGGHKSNLEINSDDTQNILFETSNGVCGALQMNYLDRIVRREIIINTNDATYYADLKNNTLQINDQVLDFPCERNDVFKAQLEAILEDENNSCLCNFDQGVNTMKIINGVEKASSAGTWERIS